MTASCFALLNKYCMECYAAMMDNREIFTRSEVRRNKKLQVFGIIFRIRQTESEKTMRRLSAKLGRMAVRLLAEAGEPVKKFLPKAG